MENIELWSPAPAQSTRWADNDSSSRVRIFSGWPTGATPPTSWPVWARTNSGEARRILPVPSRSATLRTSTLAAPLARMSSGVPSSSNTRLLVIAATSQPSAAAAAAAVGTFASNTVTVSWAPRAVRARLTLATGPGQASGLIAQNPWASRMASSSSSAVAFLRFRVVRVERGVAGLLPGRVAEPDEHQHAEREPLQRVGQVGAFISGRLGERERHVLHRRRLGGQLSVGASQQRIAQLPGIGGEVDR